MDRIATATVIVARGVKTRVMTTRERQAGPYGVTERLAVLTKPGNAGGGKGPQFRTNAKT